MSELKNYRSPNGNAIGYDAWRAYLKDGTNNGTKETIVTYDGYELTIRKNYIGNAQKVFSVTVSCDGDVTKYFNYNAPYQGGKLAENDFNRVVAAIGNNDDIFDNTEFEITKGVVLFYDERYDTHVVNMIEAPEAWTYLTRIEAETKFNEIIGA